MNGAETVMEAVARVNNLVQQPTGDAAEADSAAPPEQQGSVAPAAAAAAAAEPVASGEVRGAVQPSPRSVAQTLSTGFAVQPLPPPPAARADAVQWDAWRSELQSGELCCALHEALPGSLPCIVRTAPTAPAMPCPAAPRSRPLQSTLRRCASSARWWETWLSWTPT